MALSESMTRRCRATGSHRYPRGLTALLVGYAVSAVAESMTLVAVPWFVWQTTGSFAKTGVVVAVAAIGSAVIGILAGPWVDRLGFKPTAVVIYVIGGTALGALALLEWLGLLTFEVLLLLVLCDSALDAPCWWAATSDSWSAFTWPGWSGCGSRSCRRPASPSGWRRATTWCLR
ncbi:hypothetical protein EV385_4195 [Krasilnikovia cinnamomea]|uniref:MFS transporter n=1 Tax=Krasilnikovia cinnamomea TaxID=349313 RepID=A0A4Q7ZMU6_9ACTN|nr:MFS transporter [Krasilnikovia cinnamomea]RZU52337.1 hypothetical protein EV385_4195 [Krasilnikovia cinnamomea]